LYIFAGKIMVTADMENHKKTGAGSTQRIDSLQVVRAVAFSGLFVYHAIRTFPGSGRIYLYLAAVKIISRRSSGVV
jgi:peptidoglycan/LPS O-acetylase OafA/YrhL